MLLHEHKRILCSNGTSPKEMFIIINVTIKWIKVILIQLKPLTNSFLTGFKFFQNKNFHLVEKQIFDNCVPHRFQSFGIGICFGLSCNVFISSNSGVFVLFVNFIMFYLWKMTMRKTENNEMLPSKIR